MLAPSAAEMQLSGLRESPAPPNPSKRRASTAPPTAAELRASGHVTVSHSLRGKLVLPCADVATVGQLKAQVADRLGLDLDNLALFHRSKALRDDDDAVDAGMRFYAAYCSPASRGRGGRYYAYCSWCPGWTVRNPARLALISLIEQRWFDPLVLGLILLNVAFMCFTSPVADPTEASLMGYVTAATPVVELFFNIAFTIEMVLKLAAQGVVLVKFAYLRDGWNWLDALVVGGSWLSYGLENANYSIGFSLTPIRSVRVLRPLRTPRAIHSAQFFAQFGAILRRPSITTGTITRIRGMRVLVRSLLHSLPQLATVAMLLSFMFLCFGIGGVQLFSASGQLHSRCVGADVSVEACALAGAAAGRNCTPSNVSFGCAMDDASCLPIWADARWAALADHDTQVCVHGSDYPPSMCDEGLQV